MNDNCRLVESQSFESTKSEGWWFDLCVLIVTCTVECFWWHSPFTIKGLLSLYWPMLAELIQLICEWRKQGQTGEDTAAQMCFMLIFLISSQPYCNIVLGSLGCREEKRQTEMKLTDSLPFTNGNTFHVTLLSRARWAFSSLWPQTISTVPPDIHYTQSLC